MIRTVLIDLDDTIFDFHKAEHLALSKMLIDFGVEPKEETLNLYSEINAGEWKRLERKEITHDELKITRYEKFLKRIGVDIEAKTATEKYESYLSIGHFFVDGALEMILSIYKDYDLYIVSNGIKRVQEGRIGGSGIAKYFKKIFISQIIGFNKPDKRYFDYVFDNVENFDKEKTVIIGDSLTSDIQGGNNVGIKTVWFNKDKKENNSPYIPNYVISDLSEVKELLKRI